MKRDEREDGVMVVVRRLEPADHDAVVALSERLTIGVAPWRDETAVARAVRGWVESAIAYAGDEHHEMFVAEEGGTVVGFVSVAERQHFAGAVDAYVGELAVGEASVRLGAGKALMASAERWARDRGLAHLTLETGAANAGARAFYARLGYAEEDIRLTKPL